MVDIVSNRAVKNKVLTSSSEKELELNVLLECPMYVNRDISAVIKANIQLATVVL